MRRVRTTLLARICSRVIFLRCIFRPANVLLPKHIFPSPVWRALSSELAFCTQPRDPAGKFPISQCSAECRLTTKGSEIHRRTAAWLSPLVSSLFLSFFLPPSSSFPHPVFLRHTPSPLHPMLSPSVSPDESEQR